MSADALAELYGFGQQLPEHARGRFDELIAALANDARTRLEGEYQRAHWQLANTEPADLIADLRAGRPVPLLPLIVHGARAMNGNLKRGAGHRLTEADRAADVQTVMPALEQCNRENGARMPYKEKVKWLVRATRLGKGRVEVALRTINAAVSAVLPPTEGADSVKMVFDCDACDSGETCIAHASAPAIFRAALPPRYARTKAAGDSPAAQRAGVVEIGPRLRHTT